MNTSAATTSHFLHSISKCKTFSWGCVCWYSMDFVDCLTMQSILAFMLIQYTDSLAGHCMLLCSCSTIFLCNEEGMIICLPFIATLWIIMRSFLLASICLHILRTMLSVSLWSLSMSLNPAIRMSSAGPNTFCSLWNSSFIFT